MSIKQRSIELHSLICEMWRNKYNTDPPALLQWCDDDPYTVLEKINLQIGADINTLRVICSTDK